MVPAEDQSDSSSIEEGVASPRRRGVGGIVGRESSILIGELDICVGTTRFRSLHAAMMDSGDAQRLVMLEMHGARASRACDNLLQPRVFR